jgi:hypothetical protein
MLIVFLLLVQLPRCQLLDQPLNRPSGGFANEDELLFES